MLTRYAETNGAYSVDDVGLFLTGNWANNAGDLTRYYSLNLVIDQILKDGIIGDTAELGVYKGNTAVLIAKLARRLGTNAYLLDTFEGFSTTDLVGLDVGRTPAFSDTSLDAVKDFVGGQNVVYVKGHFPTSAVCIAEDARFSLVHIDCDLYAPFAAALNYFYPRLVRGGFLVMHDYSSLCWDGVERAVDEFFLDKPEFPIPLPDKSGSAVIRKV